MMSQMELNARLHIHDGKILEDYSREIVGKQCHCGYVYTANDKVERYNHAGGWIVEGYPGRQWLWVTCPRCKFDMSLWKIDVHGDVDHLPDAPLADASMGVDLDQVAEDHR